MAEFIEIADTSACPPGKMKRLEIGGKRILLANVAGEFYALDDTCTHEDASLSTGCLHGETVKCPLHGSRFSLKTGVPLEDPASEALQTYPLKIAEGKIWLKNLTGP
jgi:3-phenylpropionate/trans-cinnamate dioxygenase ferredoxin subunit